MIRRWRLCLMVSWQLLTIAPSDTKADIRVVVVPMVEENQALLTPATLAVVVNLNDPDSIALGRHYTALRGIPTSNILGVSLPRANFITRHAMSLELQKLKSLPQYEKMVGFALAFDRPYRVDANQSITSAFSQGLADKSWIGDCNLTTVNPDEHSSPGAPLKVRPAMLLTSGGSPAENLALAQRGKQADASDPLGEIFFVKTADRARSGPREPAMEVARQELGDEIKINIISSENLKGTYGIMGYQIGTPVISNLDTLTFLPGGYADHLTSFGGRLYDSKGQTPITAFIRAGATATFGTVREPCNFPSKFPDPQRLLKNYLGGDSLIEAYWKSVSMITEGLFVGEPLARPFPVLDARLDKKQLRLRLNRHTFDIVSEAQTFRKQTDSSGGTSKDTWLGLYSVETGHPRFMRDIKIPRGAKSGDLIADFSLGAEDADTLILGVISR